ncbi:MAG TPA: hypothetical protein ENO03_02740 [Candidatus Aminicenantes bacterium]|nr:hypothetical protein [Candidatus Aminicenantes bacterium]
MPGPDRSPVRGRTCPGPARRRRRRAGGPRPGPPERTPRDAKAGLGACRSPHLGGMRTFYHDRVRSGEGHGMGPPPGRPGARRRPGPAQTMRPRRTTRTAVRTMMILTTSFIAMS